MTGWCVRYTSLFFFIIIKSQYLLCICSMPATASHLLIFLVMLVTFLCKWHLIQSCWKHSLCHYLSLDLWVTFASYFFESHLLPATTCDVENSGISKSCGISYQNPRICFWKEIQKYLSPAPIHSELPSKRWILLLTAIEWQAVQNFRLPTFH